MGSPAAAMALLRRGAALGASPRALPTSLRARAVASSALNSTAEATTPLWPVRAGADALDALAAEQPAAAAWARATGFDGSCGATCYVPGEGNPAAPAAVLFGVGDGSEPHQAAGALPAALPAGTYALETLPGGATFDVDEADAALGFALGAYTFSTHKGRKDAKGNSDDDRATLRVSEGTAEALAPIVSGVVLCRDLINTAPNAMGPAELAAAAQALAEEYDARIEVITNTADLLERFPMVHAVGRAAAPGREPRVVDMCWGSESAPKVTIVGKGVCFDTGGLDVKPPAAMGNMKKDMGGAANALGLAKMVMASGVNVRLRVLLGCVENSIGPDSFRPSDVLTAANGITVEVGNTDAEGRLVIADALALADEEEPELLLDLTTLTGAHRVALGWDLPGVFTDDEELAAEIARHSELARDPTWRLPLWKPYAKKLASKVADTNNISTGGLAGAITAALFLQKFTPKTAKKGYCHIDMNGWNAGQPILGAMGEGGEAQSVRAFHSLMLERYGTVN